MHILVYADTLVLFNAALRLPTIFCRDLADILAAQVADSALGKIGAAASRLPRLDMLRAAKQACGILAQPADDGPFKPPAGAGPTRKTNPGYWFSNEGISMEPNTNVNGGYSHGCEC